MFDHNHLNALAAVVRHGSFDAAAHVLAVTPSAVSQRIKALEERVGATLLIRSHPVQPTEIGHRLFRHAEEIGLLEHALADELSTQKPDAGPASVRLAVNADSLDTWFIPALSGVAGLMFDIITDDQDHSAELLRRGEVQAAVTAHGEPIAGCDCTPLGRLRYRATASPDFARTYFAGSLTRDMIGRAPALTFNRKDRLQIKWAEREIGQQVSLLSHHLPSTQGFVTAAIAGIGWGLNPDHLVKGHLTDGRLVDLGRNPVLDVPLFWQENRIVSRALAPLRRAIKTSARDVLYQSA